MFCSVSPLNLSKSIAQNYRQFRTVGSLLVTSHGRRLKALSTLEGTLTASEHILTETRGSGYKALHIQTLQTKPNNSRTTFDTTSEAHTDVTYKHRVVSSHWQLKNSPLEETSLLPVLGCSALSRGGDAQGLAEKRRDGDGARTPKGRSAREGIARPKTCQD